MLGSAAAAGSFITNNIIMLHVIAVVLYFATHESEWQNASVCSFLMFAGVVFWASSGIHMILDRCSPIRQRFNVHPYRDHPMLQTFPEGRYIPTILLNQVLFGGCTGYLVRSLWQPNVLIWHDWHVRLDMPTPALWLTVINLTVQLCAYGIGFHVIFHSGHRILHSVPWLRKYHLKHHSTLANCAMTALYMHPVDAAIEVVLPIVIPWIVFGMTPGAVAAAMCLTAIDGTVTHGGYSFRFLLSDPLHHIKHHINPTKCIGAIDFSFLYSSVTDSSNDTQTAAGRKTNVATTTKRKK